MMKKGGKAQVWYTDFMIGILIFSIVLVTYFYYTEQTSNSEENTVNNLIIESKAITNQLLSTGYPINWTSNNVSTVGLTDGNYRINNNKLASFNSWSYSERKEKLHTTKQYYFYLEYLNGTRYNKLCTDPPACNDWNTSEYLVQDSRVAIHNSKIIRMVIYVYQKS